MYASVNGHVEAMRVLIEKGALIEAADKVRIHSHATTCAQASRVKVVYSKLMQINLTSKTYLQRALI